MNIAKLERLIAVYEAGSFRKAAKGFGVSQPALTWSIRQLEESLNLPLFVRGPRGITPTEACERLIVRARLIVNEQARLMAEVERSNRVKSLKLGVHPILVTRAFAAALAQFRVAHDDVAMTVVDGYSAQLQDRLRQGDLDLALCATAAGREHEDEFVFEPLLPQTYSVYGSSDHPIFTVRRGEKSGGPHDWAQVAVPNVLPGRQDDEDILRMLDRIGMVPHKAVVHSPSMPLIRTLVRHGGLLGLLPDDLMTHELEEGTVRLVEGTRLEGPPLGLLTVTGSYQTRALRRLMSILRQTFRKGPSL